MKKLMIVLLFVLLLSSCTIPYKPDDSTINNIKDKLVYFQDNRGLCYAAIESFSYSGHKIVSITNVPC